MKVQLSNYNLKVKEMLVNSDDYNTREKECTERSAGDCQRQMGKILDIFNTTEVEMRKRDGVR